MMTSPAKWLMPLWVFIWLLGYAPSTLSIAASWFEQGYGHGIWTSLLAAWFGMQRSLTLVLQPRPWSWLPVSLCSLLWSLAYLTHYQSPHQLLFVLQLLTLLFALYGRTASALLLPVFLFSLSVPVWSLLTPLLQYFCLQITAFWLGFVPVAAQIIGTDIKLPYGSLVIADGCSGLRYLLVSWALASCCALLDKHSRYNTVKLLLLATALALGMNWLRIAIIIGIAISTDMHHPWIQDHDFLGWIIFACAMLPMFFYHRRLLPNAVPNTKRQIDFSSQYSLDCLTLHQNRLFSLLFALLLLPISSYLLWINSSRLRINPPQLPTSLTQAFATRAQQAWHLQLNNSYPQQALTYHLNSTAPIEVRLGGYTRQQQDQELDYQDNHWLPNWPILSLTANTAILRGPDQHIYKALWWFQVSGHTTTELRQIKWLALRQLFNVHNPRQDTWVVVLLQRQDHTDFHLENFATHLYAALAESETQVDKPVF